MKLQRRKGKVDGERQNRIDVLKCRGEKEGKSTERNGMG
jgi:hypothetical protein